jgi:maltose alpha-D-glucosyltransferase/alpha-amylase
MAPDPAMIVYDRGIRRRLAPMLGGDLNRLKLAYALLFALPGTPVIFYGEEIGMGENLGLAERAAVRTPLQWSPARNGGFSAAAPGDLVRALPGDPRYGPQSVSIRDQNRDDGSLLNFIRQVVRTRRAHPEIGWGRCEVQDADPRVLALSYRWRGNRLLAISNLSGDTVPVDLDAAEDWQPVLGRPEAAEDEARAGRLRLPPWGYCWLAPQAGSR